MSIVSQWLRTTLVLTLLTGGSADAEEVDYPAWDGEYRAYVLRNQSGTVRVIAELVPVQLEGNNAVALSFHIRDYPLRSNGEHSDFPSSFEVSLNGQPAFRTIFSSSVRALGWVLPPIGRLQQVDITMQLSAGERVHAGFEVEDDIEVVLNAYFLGASQKNIKITPGQKAINWVTIRCGGDDLEDGVRQVRLTMLGAPGERQPLEQTLVATEFQHRQQGVLSDIGVAGSIDSHRLRLQCDG